MRIHRALAAPLVALLWTSPAAAQTRRAPRDTYEAVALYAIGATYGAATGAWIDVQAGLTEPLTAPWAPVVGAGAGVTLAWLADRPTRIRRGLPTMMGAGLALGLLAGGSIGIQGRRTDVWGVPTMSTIAWVGTTAGLCFGLAAGLLLDPEPGTGSFVLSGGFWGASLGLLAGYAFDASRAYDVFSVSGEAVGIAAAALTAGVLHPTPAQVRWMDLGALTGALLGGGIGFLLLRDERAAFAGTVQLGLIGGGVAGFLFGASRERVPGGLALRPGVLPVPGGFALTVGM